MLAFEQKEVFSFTSGYILKGKNFRTSIVRYPTFYPKPLAGTETMELYLFQPREKPVGTVVLLHGLGTLNIPFLMWMSIHMASAGVNVIFPILPGNFTRTIHKSTSGRDYFSTDLEKMKTLWETAVVDVLSVVELAKQQGWWHENSCLVGYCLGGMIAVIVSAKSQDFKKTILITAGGDIATLMWYSPTLAYFRRDVKKVSILESEVADKNTFLKIYAEDIKKLSQFQSVEELLNSDVHPLLKIDPIAYAKFIDKSNVVFVEALFDKALPRQTRRVLWEALGKPKRYLIPSGHVTWLPFQYFLGNLILKEMNIKDLKRRLKLLEKPKVEEK
ncbi:alpha/beta hydrolase [Pseudothermotoga thermarum]|uniref:Dienelactone hydrolase domain-containing protein n=1 Tax=Pseudothermotoga thermarum DSM 5069 TaxID=688269 RepID=F7YX15_9THEM|nr:alpha/beta hydrolase [Pseudothermotoga thermarum]AEH50613.1 hypothetical protein Theth_0524 [Pseudothermotoga thermarum DSM 5069]